MPFRFRFHSILVVVLLLAVPDPARADAVDGDWCFKDGRCLSIDGPNMITPGGQAHTGEYERHVFRSTIPGSEAGAGTYVLMVQWSEQEIRVWQGARKPVRREGEPEIWRRCQLRTS